MRTSNCLNISSYIITVMVFILGGCASVETVKETEGEGTGRTYPYTYEAVFNATLSAAKTKELQVIESDRETGRIILSHGITL